MSISKSDKLLVIVESPNKVKTISSILKNAGYSKSIVMASVGHIMHLGDGGPAFNSGIYPKQKFKMNLVVSDDKKKVVNNIAQQAETSNKIIIMTDDDREGSVIGWSIIKFCNLHVESCYRAVTHEITPKAVIRAIENTIPFDNDMVNAGLSRMMIDKLIGYGLSPIGKKYIGAKSIGRCQTVGLKLISDREREINNFIPELYFNLYLNFCKENQAIQAKYCGYKTEAIDKLYKQQDVDAIINDCKYTQFIIENIELLDRQESPKAPFCTATFQQEAANKLGLRVKDAMTYAQRLFESGKITYHRTDSTEFAEEFVNTLKAFICDTYGIDMYSSPRKTASNSTDQNGHEAIRVSDVNLTPDIFAKQSSNALLAKVYSLIWKRTVASAMKNAVIAETIYTINNNYHRFSFSSKYTKYKGYKDIYDSDDSINNTPSFAVGEILEQTQLEPVKKFTQPKPRFTEASLVKELQRLEIGRPSTYATIVETILSPNRGYAKLDDKHIVPTDRGMQLADYCNRSFPAIINVGYTKELEESLDKIASGKINWLDYMSSFYTNLLDIIEKTQETGIAADVPKKICPNCNADMVVRRSRFGRLFYGCSTYPKCKYTSSL